MTTRCSAPLRVCWRLLKSRFYATLRVPLERSGFTRRTMIRGAVPPRFEHFAVISGRGAARLARLVRDQEVGGSNPLAPTDSNCLHESLFDEPVEETLFIVPARSTR